jgi:hypothetical protein
MLPNTRKKDELSDRLTQAADAKKALLAKFRPKPTVVDPNFVPRHMEREAELTAVRQARADAKEAARVAREEAEEAARQALILTEEEAIAAKRADRKARKAQAKADARVKKESRQANRRAPKEAWEY